MVKKNGNTRSNGLDNFFAAFGTQNITEESIEEYMQNIISQVKEGKN